MTSAGFRPLFVRLVTAASLLCALLLTQRPAEAQTAWTATTDGNWSNAANWNNGAGPAPASDPTLQLNFNTPDGTAYNATNDIGAITLNSMTFGTGGGNATISSALPANVITLGGTNPSLTVNGGGTVTINAPVVYGAGAQITNNNGTLTLGASTFQGNVTITNNSGGVLTLADGVAYSGQNVTINLAANNGGILIGNLTAGVSGTLNVTAGNVAFQGNSGGDLFGDALLLNVASGASFNFNNNAEGMGGISGAGNISLGSASITFSLAGDRTYTGNIDGTGGIQQANNGTLSLGGTGNTFSGNTTINGGGTIKALGANVLSPNSVVAIVPGQGTLNLNHFDQTIAGLSGGASVTNTDLSGTTLTINGTLATTKTYYGFLSGNGNLVFGGLGGQTIIGPNTYTGTTTVNGGVLKLLSAQNIATGAGVDIEAGATLDAAFPTDGTWTAPLTGTGSFIKSGPGALTMAASNPGANLAGLTVNNGALVLDYSTNNNAKLGSSPALQVGSGTLAVIGNNAAATNASFNGVTLSGAAKFKVTSGNNQIASLALGAITRAAGAGSTLNVNTINTGSGAAGVTSTSQNGANGILGGWATVNGTDWAVTGTGSGPFTITPLPAAGYAANTWSTGSHTDVTSSFTNAAAAGTGSVRFNTAAANTVTLTGTNQIATGGILVTPNVGANASKITGGTITAPKDGEIYLNQYDTAAPLTISSVLGNVAGTNLVVSGGSFGTIATAGGKFIIFGLSDTAGIYPGMHVTTGTGLSDIVAADNVHVVSVDSSNQVTCVISSLQTSGGVAQPITSVNGANVTFSSGTNVVKSGPGTVNFTANNTFTGVLVLNEGVVSVATAGNLGPTATNSGSGTSSVYFNGGTLQMTGNVSPGSAVQPWFFGPNGGTIDTAGALTSDSKQGNSVYGTGTMTKIGDGTLNIGSNNSSFSGQVFVNAGVLKFTSNQFTNVLGMTVGNGGQYQINDDATANWNLGSNSVLQLNGAGVAGSTTPGAIALTDQSPTATTSSGPKSTFTNVVNLASDSTIGIYNGSGAGHVSQLTLSNSVTGPGNLTKTGDGVLVLSSAFNAFGGANGTVTVANGTLRVSGGANRLPVTTTVQLGQAGGTTSGTFDLNGQNQTVAGLTTAGSGTANQVINAAAGASTLTVNYNGAVTQAFGGQIGGGTVAVPAQANINVVKTGTGTLSLTAASTYGGSTTVGGGTLRVVSNAIARPYTVNDGAGLVVANNDRTTAFAMSTLTLGTSGTTNLGFEVNDAAGTPTIGAIAVSGSNGLTLNGTVNVSVSSLNTLPVGEFPLISYAGTIQGGGFAALNANVSLPARVIGSLVNNTANGTIDLNITAVDFIKWTGQTNGNWDTALSDQNWKTNGGGVLTTYIENAGAPGDMVTFDDTASGTKTVNLTANVNPSSVTVNTAGTYTFSGAGAITGNAGINKSGTGTLAVLTNNTNGGTTTINAGTLQVGNGGTAGAIGTGNVVDNGALVINRSDDVTLSGNVSGTGSLTKAGNNSLTISGGTNLSGDINVAGGSITLNGGTIGNLNGPGNLVKNGTGVLVATGNVAPTATTVNGGTLQIGNGGTTGSLAGDLNFAGAATLTFNRSDALTYAGNISGTGGVTIAAGTVKFTGALSYGGITDVGANSLEFATNGDVSLTNKLNGSGTFTKSGTGQLTLLNSNGFNGTFNVNGGTVLLSDQGAGGDLNASLININSGGKFIFGLGTANGGIAGENPDFPDSTFIVINAGGTYENRTGENWGGTSLRGGTLTFNGGGGTMANVTVGPGVPFVGWDLQSGSIVGAAGNGGGMTGTVTKYTSGTVTVTGNVPIAVGSAININEGVLSFTAGNFPVGTTPAASAAITLGGLAADGTTPTVGTLRLSGSGSAATTRPVNVATAGTIDVDDANGKLTITNGLNVTGTFTKTGPGTLALTSAATLPNGLTISGGTFDVEPVTGTPTVSSLPANVNVTNNGNLLVNAPNTTAASITGTGTTTVGASGNLVAANLTGSAIGNDGSLTLKTAALTGGVSGVGSLTVGDGTNAASLTLGGPLVQQNLTVQTAASVALPASGPHVASLVNTLTVQGTGKVNLGTGGIAVDYGTGNPSAVSQLRTLILAGRNGGAWNGNGITSSAVAANPGQLSIGYGEASQASLAGGNTFLGQLLSDPANTAIARVTYVGDVNLDGQVDKNDIRALATSGFYSDGQNTHVWKEGDLNGDGFFDKNDIRMIATGGVYNIGSYDATAAASLAAAAPGPKLTSAAAAAATPITYNYNPTTGDVTVSLNGNATVVEVDLMSAGNKFLTAGSKLQSGGLTFVTNSAHEQDGFSNFGSFITDGFDLGAILPTGLTLAQLQSDLTAQYSVQGNGNYVAANVAVPEPVTVSALALGAAGLLARRRRRDARKVA